MKNWNKILNDFAYKCKGGAPDFTNSYHLKLLRETLLKFGWKENATNELLGNLREGKKIITEDKPGVFFGYTNKNKRRYFDSAEELAAAIGRRSVTAAPNSGGGDEDGEEDDGKAKDLANPDTEKDAHDMQKLDSRGAKWDASYYGAEDSTEWEEHYREAEENEDEEALAQIKWFGEKQGWGEDGELPKTKEQKEKEAKQKSEEVIAKIYKKPGTLIGDDPKLPADQSDRTVKQLCLKWGYKKFEANAGKKKPAMGNAGSMFNEVISGEGTSILEQEPDLTEEELARVLYDQFCGTTLGNEVKSSDLDTGVGAGDIPGDVEGKEKGCYSKCLVTARSSKRKHQRVQESVKSVRDADQGEFDEPTKIHSFYGHKDSLEAQVAMIKNALNSDPPKKVYAPDGTEITRRPGFMTENELYALILKGGKGGNPSDTATFVEDANGNLILNFTSDKMATSDQQANSTLINEINNRKKTIEDLDPPLSDEDKQTANDEIDKHKDKVDVEQQQLKKIVAPVGEQMLKDIEDDPDALDDFIKEWESDGDGLATAEHWKDWQESIAKEQEPKWEKELQPPDKKLPPDYSQEQKRCAAKLLMKVTAGEADRPIDPKTDRPQRGSAPEVEEKGCKTKRWLSNNMAKIPARSAARRHKAGKEGYNIKEHIEIIRRNIISMERKHLAELNKITVMVDGKEKGLGEIIEGQQIVDQLHLQMMDEDDQGHPMMSHGLFEVNMGGHPVNKEVLQRCLANGDPEFDSKDFIKGFKVMAPDINEPGDRYTWSCNLSPKEPKDKKSKEYKKWENKWGKATNPRISKKTGEISKKYGAGNCADGSPRRATGRVMFIYALVQKKGGETRLVKVAEKNMRTKTGDLGKYNTTVTYHDEMKECIEQETDSA